MGAAGVVRKLIERERGVCADLEAVLQAEREALTDFSSDGVAQCVRRKNSLQRELTSLIERRREAVRALGREIGIAAEDGRVVPLLGHLPAPTAAGLQSEIAALRETLVRTRRLQRINGALIDASLELVGELVEVYRQFLPGVHYDARATVRPGAAPDAIDQRA
jgi:flagellar biosynthesis/type III secretory pathway chaperone